MNGIIVINKPAGYTSFDIVAILRRISGERHIGHTGTLDPNATGVLPVCLGKACRLIEYMDVSAKLYRCEAKLGFSSDTLDIWGEVTETKPERYPDLEQVYSALSSFVGDIMQVPPQYSAIKVNGRAMYKNAREGKEVELPPRAVTIHSLKLLSYDRPSGTMLFDVSCSKGTYVRSLCRDIGEKLAVPCIMSSLERLEAAGYKSCDAIDFESLKDISSEEFEKKLKSFESAVSTLKHIYINESQSKLFLNGNSAFSEGIETEGLEEGQNLAIFQGPKLLGIAKFCEGIKVSKVL